MNRFSKILAIVLLLALLTSVLGIFSAFAEDESAEQATYGTFIKGPDEPFGTSVANRVNNLPVRTTPKDLNGKTYYKYAFGNTPDTTTQDYIDGLGFSTGKTAADGIRVGSNADLGVEKNTDFMVVDFDMSTDTTYIDGLYFHTAFYDADYAHTGRYQPSAMYFSINGEDNDSMYIGLNGSASAAYAYAPYGEDVW
jgi:hypothetical protein